MDNPSIATFLGLPLSARVQVVSGTGLIEHDLNGTWEATGSRVNPATDELERWDDGAYEATGWLYNKHSECLRRVGSPEEQQPGGKARLVSITEKNKSPATGKPSALAGGVVRIPILAKPAKAPPPATNKELWERKAPNPWSNFSEWLAVPHHRFLLAGWGVLAVSFAGYLLTEPGSLWHKAAFWMCMSLVVPVVMALRKRSGLHAAALVFATIAVCRLFSWQQVWATLRPTQLPAASQIVAKAKEPVMTQEATWRQSSPTLTPPTTESNPVQSTLPQHAGSPPPGLKVVVIKNEAKDEYDHWVQDATGARGFLTSAALEGVALMSPSGQFIALSFSKETAEGDIRFYRWKNELAYERYSTALDDIEKMYSYFSGLAHLPPGERFISHRFRAAAWESDTRIRFDASLGTGKAVYGSFCISEDEIYAKWRPSLELDGGGTGVITPPNEKLEISMNVMPLPEAIKKGNAGMDSRRNFLMAHHRNAAISLDAFMAGYANEVLISNGEKAARRTIDILRQEEARDRAKYASIEETIVKGATMEPLVQGDHPRVEYDLQINNTLNDNLRTPYRGTARIEVQLAPDGESWRIVARRTKRFTLQRAGEPEPVLGPLQPMDKEEHESSKSSAQHSADNQVQTMHRFFRDHHLKASGDLDSYMRDYDHEVMIVDPQKRAATKSRAELTEEERKDRQRFSAINETIVSDIEIVERDERVMIVGYMLRIDNIKSDAARTRYQADVRIVSRIQFTVDGPRITARYTGGGQPRLTEGRPRTSPPKTRVPPAPVRPRPASSSRSGDWRDAAEDFEKR